MWSWLNELLLSGGLFTPPTHGVTVCVKASAHLQKNKILKNLKLEEFGKLQKPLLSHGQLDFM